VLEVSLLAPDSAGQHLADLGADVIKVEGPPRGDYVRSVGNLSIEDVSILHLRWNRGKRSVWLDLKTERGREIFLELIARSHVLIDGLRWGALDHLGLGYDRLTQANGTLVYCSLTGMGRSGPYARLATHGVFYDSYAGLAPPVYPSDDGIPRIPSGYTAVGLEAGGLYAALAILAGLSSAARTGHSVLVDVAEVDAAVSWTANIANAALNGLTPKAEQGLAASVRYSYYETKDEKLVIFQASEEKFWKNFSRAVERTDLLDRYPSAAVGDHASGNEDLRRELQKIFSERTQDAWVTLFLEADVPGGPVYSGSEYLLDPHFQSRNFVYSVPSIGEEKVRLLGTPIKVEGDVFEPTPAPRVGEHTEAVLREVGLADDEIAFLVRQVPATGVRS